MTPIMPMLASVGQDIPRGDGWVFEPKYDGIRVLAFVDGGQAALVSRNGIDKTKQFPEIAEALVALNRKVKRPFVVDGEIVVMRDDAPLRFQELQSRMHVTDRLAIEGHREATPAALMVFDMLLDGKTSLVTEPWRERRNHLAALLRPPGAGSSALRLSDVSTDGSAMLDEARAHDWEGIIAKRADAPYAAGHRTRDWLKLKLERRQEFVVGGWTEPRNAREHIGAILLGYYDGGDFIYAGHTGGGFSRKSLSEMYRLLKPIERDRSPFTVTPKTNEAAHWTDPRVVVEVKFNEWTAGGHLRQPIFLGVREDKRAEEVIREPESVPARSSSPPLGMTAAGVIDTPTGRLEVSNLDKVFFPATKQTKGDVMRFYAEMAPYILPAIADRPLVMKRFPNGVEGKAFYQQKAPAEAPPSVRVEAVSDEGLTAADRLIGGDLATLLYVVQLGAISIDPWHSRVQSVQYADYSVIDLDPGPRAPFARVVEVAHAVKETLDRLGLRGVPKTSGASGLHVYLPLPSHVPNDGARIIAELVATSVAERYPKIATIERWVSSRPKGAVYVDFLQNIRGKTVAGVYSVRAQSRATVSTPLEWSEITDDLDPTAFTIETVPGRVRERGDLWAKGMKTANKLDALTKTRGGRRG